MARLVSMGVSPQKPHATVSEMEPSESSLGCLDFRVQSGFGGLHPNFIATP